MLRLSMLLLVARNRARVAAQAYPTEPMRAIIPASHGDRCDVPSRLVGEIRSEPPAFSAATMGMDIERKRARDIRFAPR